MRAITETSCRYKRWWYDNQACAWDSMTDVTDVFTIWYQPSQPQPASELSCTVSRHHARRHHPDEVLRKSVDSVWFNRLQDNPTLFNGTKFRLAEIEPSTDGSSQVHLRMSITDYASYLGTNWNVSFIRSLGTGVGVDERVDETILDRSYFSDCLGVGGIVLTTDGYIVLIRRGAHVAEYPNCVDVPGGHPEPSRVEGCDGPAWEYAPEENENENEKEQEKEKEKEKEKEESKEKDDLQQPPSTVSSKALVDEFYQSILEEIYEEVNIPLSKLHDTRLLCIIRQTAAGGKPSGIFQISCSLTSTEVKELYSQGPPDAEETTALVLMSTASVREMEVEEMSEKMCPACVASLVIWKSFLTK